MDSKNDSKTDKNPSTNLTIRKSKEIGMESVVVAIQHKEQHPSAIYSCSIEPSYWNGIRGCGDST